MVYFVRHGETDWNIDFRCQGTIDIPLNEKGIRQTRETALRLKGVEFDVKFCSPLTRAKQTFEIICGTLPTQFEIDNRLIERDFGILEGLRRNDFDFDSFWNVNIRTEISGAESLFAFEDRVSSFYEFINKNYADKNVLVVSHGGVAFVLLSYLYGMPDDGNYSHRRLSNSECAMLDISAKTIT